MRLSPVLIAILATSATLGISRTAQGQTPSSVAAVPSDATPALQVDSVKVDPVSQPESSSPSMERTITTFGAAVRTGVEEATPPAPPEPMAARLGTLEKTARPGKLAQAGPGNETTPNRIQITPGGTPPADRPAPTLETPAPTPAAPATPAPAPAPTPGVGEPSPAEAEPRVLVSEVAVSGAEGTLQDEVYRVIRTQPGRTTTRSQLQEDINAIFATGFFSSVRAVPTDTALGVRVTFEVQPNPVLQSVQVQGNVIKTLRVGERTVPFNQVVDETFRDQYGSTLNLRRLQEGINRLNKIYQDNGFVLAQVVDAPRVSPDGTVTLEIAEGVVENLQVRFLNKEGEERDAKGNPIRGRTRDFIVKREFQLKPGDVFNRSVAERDLQRVFGLGIFEDVKLSLQPGTDPRRVVVVVNVTERNTGSIAAGAGYSSASGLFGTLSYQEQNFGGNNQKLGGEVQIGERELLFDLSFTDPWIGGDPFRTSYTLNFFRRRTISLIFDGGDPEIRLPNGDRPRVLRTGGGISFSRPLSPNPYARPEWVASLGLQYQRVNILDRDGEVTPRDQLGNLLSFSESGRDDLFTAQLGVVRDRRNDPLRPTQGSLLRLGMEQSLPFGSGSILLNRLRGSYSFYIPTRLTRFTAGCRARDARPSDCPQAFAFNVQAGTILGDLPPYEAFSLGGSNSVRGYDEGDVGAGRRFIQASAEYRFPVFSIFSGALFIDAATDLGSGDDVPGNPAGVRGKPGSGVGYGLGVRIQSPLGPIRIDYGFNDEGDSRIHFGIGERF